MADAVAEGNTDFSGWDGVDLIAAFNPGSTIHIEPVRPGSHLLGAAAGVVMFLPLIWTWWGLHQATNAYNRLLDSQPELADGVSFLQLWITGFAGELASLHRLGTVTIVSVGLIVIATAILIGNRWYSEQGHRIEESRYSKADAELATLLTAAQREMAQASLSRGASYETLVLSVDRLIKAHRETSDASAQVAATVKKAHDAITTSISQVSAVSAQLAGTTDSFDRAASKIGGAADKVEQQTQLALGRLAKALEDAAAASQSKIAAAQEQSTTELAKATDGLTAAHDELKKTFNEFAASRKQAQQSLDRSLADSADARRSVSQDFEKVMAQVQALFVGMDQRLAQVENVSKELQDAFVLNREITQAQVNELTRARDALALLAQRDFVRQT